MHPRPHSPQRRDLWRHKSHRRCMTRKHRLPRVTRPRSEHPPGYLRTTQFTVVVPDKPTRTPDRVVLFARDHLSAAEVHPGCPVGTRWRVPAQGIDLAVSHKSCELCRITPTTPGHHRGGNQAPPGAILLVASHTLWVSPYAGMCSARWQHRVCLPEMRPASVIGILLAHPMSSLSPARWCTDWNR